MHTPQWQFQEYSARLRGLASAQAQMLVLASRSSRIGVMVQGFGRADEHGTLPPDTPRWITALQHLVALAIVFCLATVGTWVALFGEADQFTVSSSLGETRAPPTMARVAFGIGAAITWLFLIALAKRTMRAFRN